MGYGLPQADLIQEGNLGLMKAVKRFDPERGVRLASFAIHWIKAEIHEYILRNWRMVKIATTKAQRKLFFNLRSMKKSHRRAHAAPRSRQVAQTLNVKESDVIEMEKRIQGGDIALDPSSEDGEERRLADRLPRRQLRRARRKSSSASSPSRARTQGLAKALESLDERSRRIIQARWLRRGAIRRRCTSSPTNSASRPSASARSKRRRCRR